VARFIIGAVIAAASLSPIAASHRVATSERPSNCVVNDVSSEDLPLCNGALSARYRCGDRMCGSPLTALFASVREERRHRHVAEDVARYATKHELAHARVTVGSHDQKVGAEVGEAREDVVAHAYVGGH